MGSMVGAKMHGYVADANFLGPEDLALCQRVFDRICAESKTAPSDIDSELLASNVLMAFQHGVMDEAALVAEVRAKLLKRTG